MRRSVENKQKAFAFSPDRRHALDISLRNTVSHPDNAEVTHRIGVLLADTGFLTEGLRWIDRSLVLQWQSHEFLVNKSIVYQRLGQLNESKDLLNEILVDAPLSDSALLNLAHTEKDLKNFRLAIFSYEKVIALRPGFFPPYEHLSFCYAYPDALIDRVKVLERASVLVPDVADVEYQLGLYYLMLGKFNLGWDLLRFRWDLSHVRNSSKFSKRLIFGRPLFDPNKNDGTVFIWAEQGLGDEIMFLSLLDEFYQKYKTPLIVQIDPRMKNIWRNSFPEFRFISRSDIPDESEFTSHLPSGDLPRLLRRSSEAFLNNGDAFLQVDSRREYALSKRIRKDGDIIVGLSWKTINGESRCIPLGDLIRTIQHPKIKFVNLQYGDCEAEIRQVEASFGRPIFFTTNIDTQNDLDGLGALIKCCDVVVSIANSTAHLAGALGVPVIALLPFFPGWRWLMEGEQSLWYKTVKLVRQDTLGDWSNALERARSKVMSYVSQ